MHPDVTRKELFAYVAGVLDPPRTLEIEEQLLYSHTLRARLKDARSSIGDTSGERDAWRIPPPGIHGKNTLRVTTEAAGVMRRELQERSRVAVWIPEDVNLRRRIAVLFESPGGWEVVFPTEPAEEVELSVLPLGEDGRRRLEIVLRLGTQRWAVALPQTIDWSAPDPWEATRKQIASGEVPLSTLQFSAP